MPLWFQKNELMELMQNFYTLTGIRIILFDEDHHEQLCYPPKENTLCFCLRKNPSFDKKCRESDAESFRLCRKSGQTQVFKCHAGLSEATAPIMEKGRLIGYMMFGQVTDDKNKESFFEHMTSLCTRYGITEDLSSMIKKVKYRNAEQLRAAAKLLEIYVHYVRLQELVQPSGQQLIDQIDVFLEEHMQEEIDVSRICREFDLSRTRLYDLIRPYTNGGIAAYVKHKRLEYAKKLIQTTDLPLSRIADAAGFSDYNYFLRLFKQKYGLSSRKLRAAASEPLTE